MGTYNLPRNVKGEGRLLIIFSTKSLIYSAVGAGIGFLFNLIFQALNIGYVGIIIMVVLAFIGFSIATFKMPNMVGISWASKNSGENIDDVIIRAFKFKQKQNRIYIAKDGRKTKEERKNDK